MKAAERGLFASSTHFLRFRPEFHFLQTRQRQIDIVGIELHRFPHFARLFVCPLLLGQAAGDMHTRPLAQVLGNILAALVPHRSIHPEPTGLLETTLTIQRSEFGMTALLNGLSDEVRITVSVEGVKP